MKHQEFELTVGQEDTERPSAWLFRRKGRGKIDFGPVSMTSGGSRTEHLAPDADSLRVAMITAQDAVLDRFVILARDGQFFMQCLCTPSGWRLEKREGDADHHYRALVCSEDPSEDVSTMDPTLRQLFNPSLAAGTFLEFDEVFEAMRSYLALAPEPVWLGWEKYEL